MLRKGYIQQQIEALGLIVARLLHMRQTGDHIGALAEVKIAFRSLTGLDADTVDSLPEHALLDVLKMEGRLDPGKSLVLGTLLDHQSELEEAMGQTFNAQNSLRKALTLLLEALYHEPTLRTDEHLTRITHLVERSEATPPGLLLRLFRHHELLGEFAKAEDALYALRESGITGVDREAVVFYRRLLALPDDVLEAGNLPREEVEAGLTDALKRIA